MEQPDGGHGTAPRTGTRPVMVAVAVVLALVLALLAGAATGSWDRPPAPDPPTGTATGEDATSSALPTTTFSPPPLPEAGEGGDGADTVLRWILLGLATLVAVGLALLIIRFVLALLRRGEPVGAAPRMAVGATGDDEMVEVPEIQDGIAQAQALLDEGRPTRDAIIQAWLALEEGAARSGVVRTPSQTPSEFTAAVLRRTPADHDAVEVLLRLYLHARFSEKPLRDADGAAARDALATIASSWATTEAPG